MRLIAARIRQKETMKPHIMRQNGRNRMASGTIDIEKIEKTATRGSSFQFVRRVSHY